MGPRAVRPVRKYIFKKKMIMLTWCRDCVMKQSMRFISHRGTRSSLLWTDTKYSNDNDHSFETKRDKRAYIPLTAYNFVDHRHNDVMVSMFRYFVLTWEVHTCIVLPLLIVPPASEAAVKSTQDENSCSNVAHPLLCLCTNTSSTMTGTFNY